jgi:2-hydroxychromene-2-carboxylate isomerase
MTREVDWYFDYVSPYAYLQFESFHRLPDDLEVRIRPVLFAGLLGHWESKGPAEIPAKRRQTYRYCDWLARRRGIPFRAPPRHPFNPLAVLRLTLALGATRAVTAAIFRHIWGEGLDGQEPAALRALAAGLGVADLGATINDPAVKQALRDNTDEALARGVFGIPTFVIGEEIFWGEDVTEMMLEYLADPAPFQQGEWARLADLPVAAERKESRLR